ncbi:MAG: putative bifunctional diguanylate cyclase/phosphodiesterase, partial [Solirubrobacteraceae bacterium]
MASTSAAPLELEPRQPGRGLALVQLLALLAAIVLIALTAHSARWSPLPLGVIAVFAVVSDLTSIDTGSTKLRVSGTALGLMLALVLFGAGPAAVIGLLTLVVGWPRSRGRVPTQHFVANLPIYAWFLLITGFAFHAAVDLAGVTQHDAAYYLIVFLALVMSVALNFVGIAGYLCYLDRSSLLQRAREALLPLLSAQLFSGVLTMISVYIAARTGTVGITVVGLMIILFQYLIGELLTSERRGKELERVANTDELTGLANRERFRTQLEDKLSRAGRADESFAVMLLDLDRFKEINDTLGHHYGDQLLRELGPRLVECVGPDGIVARMGGDEFAVLPAEQTADPEELERYAREIIEVVQRPFEVEQMTLQVGASVGVARFPLEGDDPHTLLRRADKAMYAAKDANRGVDLYASGLDRDSRQRLSLLSDFRRALESDELVVHYQPIVDVRGAEVRGAEGLVRWEHPEHGLLPPGAFIAAVEQTGLIGPLTRHVLERSIAQCATWRTDGKDLSVAVNLSVRNLMDPDLPTQISTLLDIYGLPANALQLEITESMIMSDPERALAIVGCLSELGVRLSVDDFGTGYSSLANLKRLPIDELKIDRSFVSPMMQDESDLIIVRSTINLGH